MRSEQEMLDLILSVARAGGTVRRTVYAGHPVLVENRRHLGIG